jgi:exodeoxyribonuclease V gamma subunit
VTRHRLQPFSREYFRGLKTLFSYSQENFEALKGRQQGRTAPVRFMSEPLPVPLGELRELQIRDLLAFYANPTRHFVRNCLGIFLDDDVPQLEEREPFAIGGLGAYHFKQELLEHLMLNGDPRTLLPVARGRGLLPPAGQGEFAFRAMVCEVEGLAEQLRLLTSGAVSLAPLDVSLEIDGILLTGSLSGVWPDALLRYRFARMGGKDQIVLWIEHLVLNALDKAGYPRESRLMMADGAVELLPCTDPLKELGSLVSLYREGLRKPLRFFPRSSQAYMKKKSLDDARKEWSEVAFAEGVEPYNDLVYGESDPFDAEFEGLAERILAPFLRCRGE